MVPAKSNPLWRWWPTHSQDVMGYWVSAAGLGAPAEMLVIDSNSRSFISTRGSDGPVFDAAASAMVYLCSLN